MDNTGGNFVGEGERSASLQDSYNRAADYSLASQDVPKRFFVAYVYELPVGRGKRFLNQGGAANALLGGWQLNGVTTIQSGNPVFIDQACNRGVEQAAARFRGFLVLRQPRPQTAASWRRGSHNAANRSRPGIGS